MGRGGPGVGIIGAYPSLRVMSLPSDIGEVSCFRGLPRAVLLIAATSLYLSSRRDCGFDVDMDALLLPELTCI